MTAPTQDTPLPAVAQSHPQSHPRATENSVSARSTHRRAWTYAWLLVAVAVTLLPFAWMLLGSFKTQGEILRDPNGWVPQAPTLSNYQTWFGSCRSGNTSATA